MLKKMLVFILFFVLVGCDAVDNSMACSEFVQLCGATENEETLKNARIVLDGISKDFSVSNYKEIIAQLKKSHEFVNKSVPMTFYEYTLSFTKLVSADPTAKQYKLNEALQVHSTLLIAEKKLPNDKK